MISDPVRAAHAAAVSHAAYLVVVSQLPVARSHLAAVAVLPAVACQLPLAVAVHPAGVFLHPLLAAAVPSAVALVAVVPTAVVVPIVVVAHMAVADTSVDTDKEKICLSSIIILPRAPRHWSFAESPASPCRGALLVSPC